jgi:putative oxidoreductase
MAENTGNPSFGTTGRRPLSKTMNIIAWVLQVLVALAFLAAGGSKLAGAKPTIDAFDKIGIGQWFRILTGSLELIGAIALLIPRLRFYGAVLLLVVMIGAITAHLTVLGGNPTAAIVLLAFSGTIAYLRRPQK